MADFNLFLPGLLQREGCWANNSADLGGATNKGITFGLLRECSMRLFGILATIEGLRQLSDADAGVIYKSEFWDRCHADDIDLQLLAEIVVDFAVNAGLSRAGKLLQSVINQLLLGGHVAVDGVIGPATIAALNGVNQSLAYGLYRAQRIEAYQQIAAANPKENIFLDGWINRVNSFPTTC